MKTFSEAKGDTAVFTFGRFNPPTTGHEKLIDALAKQQQKNSGSLMYVYPSHSQDAKKNPLPHSRKVAYMKKMFRKYARNIITSKSRNVFEIAVELHNKGHRAVVMVVGSDRVQEFDRLLNQYNGVEGKHGYYGFDDIRVVSAGERDPDAEGVEGMSASKMRAAAAQGDFDSFQQGLPRNFGDGKKLFDDIRKNMGVREQNWTDEEIMRDAYIRGEVWNVGDVVETKLGEEGTIIRKGTNYVVFENMQRVWLHDLVEEPKKITKTKQAKGDVADVKGTQPAKYYSKDAEGDDMSKSTKIARARHFAKGGSRDDAPGDKGAKTKPSQYTKKYKQMYGEGIADVVKSAKLLAKYYKTRKDEDAFKAIKFGWSYIQNPKVREMIVSLIKYISSKYGHTDWNNTIKYIKKKTGVDISDYHQDWKSVKGGYTFTKFVPESKNFKQMYGERAKKAVAGGKVQKLVTAHGLAFKGKKYKEIDMELKGIDNNTQMVTFNIIHPKEIFGNEVKIPFKTLRRGPFMATDTSKINEQDKKEPAKSDQEKERDEFKKLQKDKRIAALQFRMAKDAETVAKLSAMERKLSDGEKDKLKKLEKDIDKKDFIDRYGKEEGESIYYATLTKLAKGEEIEEDNPCWDTHKQVGMKKKNGKMVPNCVPKEEIEEINLPALIKSVIHRATHPKGYAKMLQAYIEMVKDQGDKHANKFYASRVATMFGMNTAFPLIDYINKLVKKGMLPTTLMAQYEVDESFQLDEKIEGLVNKSKQTGVPYSILKKSYDRGMAAWKGGHRPGASQQQWAFARVNSMLTGGKADPDLQKQIKDGGYKKKKKKSESITRESIEEWYSDNETISMYQGRYGDEWLKKLNNTYEAMLSKLPCCDDCSEHFDHIVEAAEYQGKKVKLNDPIRTSENPKKKFKVYVKNEKGTVVVVRFGDPNMGINRDDPERRKSFRARHNCDDPGPKWKARYWSCYQWRAGAKVDN